MTTDDRAVRLALDVGRLTRERDELRATLARVEALADDHDERSGRLWGGKAMDDATIVLATAYGNFARRVRAALEQP